MKLPPDLAPWAPQLAPLTELAAKTLGPWIRRLSAAVGPLGASAATPGPTPDGIDGLARRGTWERLLVQEWLWAEEAPEEFVRRAADREQAFLRIAYRQPRQSGRCLVLLDAGPAQVGAPRLAQLAALVMLARRADDAGAELRWGVLQDPGRRLIRSLRGDTLRRWLDLRSLAAPAPEDVDAILAAARYDTDNDDLWLIGGADIARLRPPAASTMAVEDVVEPDVRALDVRLTRPSGPLPAARLPLPPDRRCTRLIRSPFAAHHDPGVDDADARPARDTSLLFSADGRRLFARSSEGGVIAYHVPNSPRARPGHPRVFPPVAGELVVAAGWSRRSMLVVTSSSEGLVVRAHGGRDPAAARPRRFPIPDHEPRTRGPLMPIVRFGPGSRSTALLLPSGALYVRSPSTPDTLRMGVDVRALTIQSGEAMLVNAPAGGGFAPLPRAIVALRAEPAPWLKPLVSLPPDGRYEDTDEEASLPEPHRVNAFFGHGGYQGPGAVGLAAVEHTPGVWRVVQGSYVVDLETELEVVGVVRNPQHGLEPCLVVLDEERHRLGLLGRRSRTTVMRTADPVVAVSASPVAPMVAVLTADGELTVTSLEHRRAVLAVTDQGEIGPTGGRRR